MAKTIYAGIDAGTTVIKGQVIDNSGEILKAYSVNAVESYSPQPGFNEIDPEAYYGAFLKLFETLFRGLSGYEVYLGISAMAPVLIPVGKDKKPLVNGILYNDTRAWKEIEELKEACGDLIFKINGNPVNQQQWLPKIIWLKKNMPEKIKASWKLMDLSSYIIWKLSGETVVDKTVALEEGLVDYRTRNISKEILNAVELSEDLLPDVYETQEEAVKFNKENIYHVNAGTVDAIASAVSFGLLREGMIGVILGTTGIIFYSTSSPVRSEKLYLDLSPKVGIYYVNGSTASAGSFLDFTLELLGLDKNYSEMENMLKRSKPGSGGVVSLPYIAGERTPIFDPKARSVFFGISSSTTRDDIVRSSVEAVAFSIRHNLEEIEKLGYRANTCLLYTSPSPRD